MSSCLVPSHDKVDFEFNEYATDYNSRTLWRDDSVQIIAGNVATTNFLSYSGAYGPLKKTVRPEWAINISGLQVGQAVRVHMCAYYETIPMNLIKICFYQRGQESLLILPKLNRRRLFWLSKV